MLRSVISMGRVSMARVQRSIVRSPIVSAVMIGAALLAPVSAWCAEAGGGQAEGGSWLSLLFYVVNLYRQAFDYHNMGYASAMAWLLFVIVMAATLLALYGSSRWVYYEVSER